MPGPEQNLTLEETAVTAQAGHILFGDLQLRPHPHAVARLISAGMTTPIIHAVAEQVGLSGVIMHETMAELEQSMPYYQAASDAIANDFPDRIKLFAGRDAENLYDDFSVVHPDHRSHLMPASPDLWLSQGMKTRPLARNFLAGYDLRDDTIYDGEPAYLLIDSGFLGRIGQRLDSAVQTIYGQSILETGQLTVKLLGASLTWMRILDITLDPGVELTRVRRHTNKSDPHMLLGTALQLLPRYHGRYIDLRRKGDIITPVSAQTALTLDVDNGPRNKNSSIVNPLGAALVQHAIVKAAMERTQGSRSAPLHGPDHDLQIIKRRR
jgi:hypothetical protein